MDERLTMSKKELMRLAVRQRLKDQRLTQEDAAGMVDARKSLHSLRHSAISQVARRASIDTTMIYVHEADRLDNPGEQYIDYQNGNGG